MRVRRLGLAWMVAVALCALGAVLGFGSASALAVAPEVTEAVTVSGVGSSSAGVVAGLDPQGQLTSYRFEYASPGVGAGGWTTAGVPGEVDGTVSTGVSAHLEGLQPDTSYEVRVTATNAGGTTTSPPGSFRTFPVGLLGLPDERGYEMVSPVENVGQNVYEPQLGRNFKTWSSSNGNAQITLRLFQAAASGDAVAYPADPPVVGGNGSEGKGKGNEFLARRSGVGWSVTDIQPPEVVSPAFEAFSSDMSIGIIGSADALSPQAPEGGYGDVYSTTLGSGVYRPLITVTPPHTSPTQFGSYFVYKRGDGIGERVAYAGASSSMTHVLFEANDALTPIVEGNVPTGNDLYDSVGGELYLVNVLPDGEPNANATFGSKALTGNGEERADDFSHVISADGSRIFWTDLSTGDLYVRVNDTQPQSALGTKGECLIATDACTVQVDASRGPDSGGGGRFWTASSDGSRVFFTDENRLTDDSTAASGAPDLYEYDLGTSALRDLSVDGHAGEHADVVGVVGASEDGSYVYFVAAGALANGAIPQACIEGDATTTCNLYVLHDGESVKFVTALSGKDNETANNSVQVSGDWMAGFAFREAQVTPDGRHLAFMSIEHVLYDGSEEMFVYDAGSGGVACASCNPSGESQSTQLTAAAPVSHNNTYMQRFISDDGGRTFFDSAEGLVPADVNGQVDAYEWERDGTGSCRRPEGCVYLLSGGTSLAGSYFIDASTSGNDVFVVTRAQLVPQDQNEEFDLYDARVGASEPVAPPACSGTGCQGVPGAPPIFATPSSVTFSGVGNFSTPPKTIVKQKKKPKRKPKTHTRKKPKTRAGKSTGYRHGKAHGARRAVRSRGKAGR